jgi:ABC-type transport system involved in multi-copper enzyme maturation permease subunit
LYCGQSRFLGELYGSISRGIGAQLTVALGVIGIAGLCCTFLVDEPVPMLQSLSTLFTTGQSTSTFTLPGIDSADDTKVPEYVPLPLKYDPRLVQRVVVNSNRNIVLADGKDADSLQEKPLQIEARNEIDWNTQLATPSPIPMVIGGNVYAQNLEVDEATVTFTLTTVPPYPETLTIFLVAVTVLLIGLAWMLQQAASPKVAAIAMAAAKSELSQPLPFILMLMGGLMLVLFVFLPFHTEGEDIKMLKDCSLTLILVVSLFQGVWSASSSVSDEIEGRTALTLLSKPIHRRSFILGKMLGITWVLLFLLIILGGLLLLTVSYKPIYDARESSADMPLWQLCHLEMVRTLPGLAMVFLQASTLSAIAVALATRIPLLANFAICFTLYLVGHLTPSIVSSSSDGFPIIQFIAQLIAVIVPTLDWYSMDKAIDTGHGIPAVYLAGVLIYSALYTAFAVFLGLLLFEDRDLA